MSKRIADLEIRPECLCSFEQWVPPSKEEVNRVLDHLKDTKGANKTEVARITGVLRRQVYRWSAGDVDMRYAEWALLCYEAGLGEIWRQPAK